MSEELRENTESNGFECIRLSGSKPAEPRENAELNNSPSESGEPKKQTCPIDLTPAENMTAFPKTNIGSKEIVPTETGPMEISQPDHMKAKNARSKKRISVVGWILILIGISAALLTVFGTRNGIGSVQDAFEREKDAAADEAYQMFYDTSYDAAEHDYHVKNRAVITLSGIREETELEVLNVRDIAYMIKEKGKYKFSDTRLWLEVPGTGVFTVNLAAGEFLVDNERNSVYVRLPRPSLSENTIVVDSDHVKILKEDSSPFNSSPSDGTELVLQMLGEAQSKIREDIKSNLEYYEYAEESARSLLETWIRAVNKDVEDLTVEIEFY